MMFTKREACNIFNENHIVIVRILFKAFIVFLSNFFVSVQHTFQNLSIHLSYSLRSLYKTGSVRIVPNSNKNLTNRCFNSFLIDLLFNTDLSTCYVVLFIIYIFHSSYTPVISTGQMNLCSCSCILASTLLKTSLFFINSTISFGSILPKTGLI